MNDFELADKPCPRCGRMTLRKRDVYNALSRHTDEPVYICPECGVDEALRDMMGDVLPLSDWWINKH